MLASFERLHEINPMDFKGTYLLLTCTCTDGGIECQIALFDKFVCLFVCLWSSGLLKGAS